MSAYLITRDGEELGSFEISQIQEGLRSGQFETTDWAWREGMADWKPLSSVVAMPSVPAPTQDAVPPRNQTVVAPLASQPVNVPKPTGISSPPSVGTKPGAINPYASSATTIPGAVISPVPTGAVPPSVVVELAGTKPWVRLISVLMWISCIGVLVAVGLNIFAVVVGANALAQEGKGAAGVTALVTMAVGGGITALLVLYPTLKLTKYASNISRLSQSKSFTDLALALREQRRFWKFYGILTVIYICLLIGFALLVAAGMGMSFMSKGMVQP